MSTGDKVEVRLDLIFTRYKEFWEYDRNVTAEVSPTPVIFFKKKNLKNQFGISDVHRKEFEMSGDKTYQNLLTYKVYLAFSFIFTWSSFTAISNQNFLWN